MGLSVGVVGFGYWGPNIVRNLISNEHVDSVLISEESRDRRSEAQKRFPNAIVSEDSIELIESTKTDAIVIATPPTTHFELASRALHSGKAVLVEKPLATSIADAEKLVELAATKSCVLMVDHTFLYTGAVRKMRELISKGAIGTPTYYDSTRINLGLFRSDTNVVWDLAPHDVSILNYLSQSRPIGASATGFCHVKPGIENIAYLTLFYDEPYIAHISCSWSSPVKVRRILVGGSLRMLVYDDIEPTEKLKVYDSGLEIRNEAEQTRLLVDYRVGDIHVPKLDSTEALVGVISDFCESIISSRSPLSDGSFALDVVRVLVAANESIGKNGAEVEI